MRDAKIECDKCDTEFDGATDAERFHVIFCPMHKAAAEMLSALKAISSDWFYPGNWDKVREAIKKAEGI